LIEVHQSYSVSLVFKQLYHGTRDVVDRIVLTSECQVSWLMKVLKQFPRAVFPNSGLQMAPIMRWKERLGLLPCKCVMGWWDGSVMVKKSYFTEKHHQSVSPV
jgi:hypothetical protein